MQKAKTRRRRRPLVGRKFCVMKIRRRLVYPIIRNELFGVFVFSKWAVRSRATSSCTGQQIRNQRRRTLRKTTKELLEEYLARRASILGGDIRPLVTHSSMRKLRDCLSLYQREEKAKWSVGTVLGTNLPRRTLWCNVLLMGGLVSLQFNSFVKGFQWKQMKKNEKRERKRKVLYFYLSRFKNYVKKLDLG